MNPDINAPIVPTMINIIAPNNPAPSMLPMFCAGINASVEIPNIANNTVMMNVITANRAPVIKANGITGTDFISLISPIFFTSQD